MRETSEFLNENDKLIGECQSLQCSDFEMQQW